MPLIKSLTVISVVILVGVSAEGVGMVRSARAAQAEPNIICCGDYFSGVTTWVNATNVTINFTTAFAPTSGPAIEFGNTSAGEVFSQNATEYSPSTLTGKFFLDYLQPATTYDFKLVADGGGDCIHNSIEYYCYSNGNFTTQTDSYGVSSINGVNYVTIWVEVTDVNGSRAPNNLAVILNCYYSHTSWYHYLALTSWSPNGQQSGWASFQWNLGLYGYCSYGMVVRVANYNYGGAGNGTWQWVDRWNETLWTYAPQFVHFELPTNFVGPFVPEVLDFSNASGGYAKIQYLKTFSTSTTLSNSWSVEGGLSVFGVGGGGGASGSATITQTNTTGNGPFTDGPTLDWGAKWWSSGFLQFNAAYRTWNVTSIEPYQVYKDGNAVSGFGLTPPSSWLIPANVGKNDTYYMLDGNGVQMVGVPEANYSGYSWYAETSTTTQIQTGYNIFFGLAIVLPLPGAPTVSFRAHYSWSQTSSTSYTQDLEWSIGGGYNPECYDVIGQGGSQSAGTADMVGIVMYSPTTVYPDGQVVCSPSGL